MTKHLRSLRNKAILGILLGVSAWVSPEASAHSPYYPHPAHYPYTHEHYHEPVWGFGLVPYVWVSPYGYSYWSYWGHHPYYASFGAIAYGRGTHSYGLSTGAATRVRAEEIALSMCGADDCKTIVWVQGGCAAMARSAAHDRMGYGMHAQKYKARSYAMRGCRNVGVTDCKIVAWTCAY